MTESNVEREIGALDARMEGVETALASIARDVRAMRDDMLKLKGGWLTLTVASVIAGSISAFIVKMAPYLTLAVR